MIKFILSGVVLTVACAQPAAACQFDTDCEPGSTCAKAFGQVYGVCVGGLNPGNSYDQAPVYAPLDPNGTYGNTCQFDVDCGLGSTCAKSSGSIEGVCLR